MRTGEHPPISEQPITLQDQSLEEVQSFPYSGSEVDQLGKVQKEIVVRRLIGCIRCGDESYSRVGTSVLPPRSVYLDRAETWAVTQQHTRKLKTFQMRCLEHDAKHSDPWKNWWAAGGRPVEAETLTVAGASPENAWPSHPKQLMRCRPSGRGRPPGGAPLRWSDLVNRDLSGVSE